ncbi:MAG: UbiD family decarboxylase [Chloroflexi bacterium]|nr:UbiD family decarboxylase [Chloroflexota bacterium]MCI0579030.1 UbiD family decarboxylase [Chloroflexota bacterium]MCI0646957.1 UbiD family decarboxylase [Chloroflexota bacterium]MCI0730009.1 UbiD family decarboxylase [Chloroflexota bacterium]
MSFRSFIQQAAESGDLMTIDRPVSTTYELANVAHALEGRPVLFTNVEDHPGWRVCAGPCSDRKYFSISLGVPVAGLVHHLAQALANPVPPPLVASGPCQEVVRETFDLRELPILLHLPQDAGRYIASNVVIIKDPELGRNMCYHRLLLLDDRHFAARIVERRGTDTALSKTEGDFPVAICIGVSLATHLAASMSPPPGVDELSVAHALAPTPLVKCLTSDLEVPADAEIVLEGRITRRRVREGPFMDLTETMDFVREQPVVEIDLVTHRRDPIYHALLPGGLEHKLLMGMPREPTIWAEVNKVTRCTGVAITPGGASWLHAVVQIDKQGPDDGRLAIEAAFRGHSSLKHVWVVDTDIDIYDPAAVEWAMATRFQADQDLVILENQPGSSLDPSGIHTPGQKSRTAKMGLDCTIPWGADRSKYEKGQYGPINLDDYLPGR